MWAIWIFFNNQNGLKRKIQIFCMTVIYKFTNHLQTEINAALAVIKLDRVDGGTVNRATCISPSLLFRLFMPEWLALCVLQVTVCTITPWTIGIFLKSQKNIGLYGRNYEQLRKIFLLGIRPKSKPHIYCWEKQALK